jgi:DNA helicase HerA-like ATPase
VTTAIRHPRLSRYVGLADLYDEISSMLDAAHNDRRVSSSEREGLQVVQMRLQNFAYGERMAKIYARDVHEDELANPAIRELLEEGDLAPEGCIRLHELIGDGQVTLLEGGLLDPAVKKAIVTALATSIFTRARIRGAGAFNPERLIVLEEAHEVMTAAQDSAAEIGGLNATIWEQMWNEGREYGLRLMAIAQVPTALPPSVIANSSTKLIHKLETGPDQSAMMVALGKDERIDHRPYKRFIGNLSPGMCIVRSHASGHYEDADPVLVNPDLLPLGQPSDAELRRYSIRH